MTDFADRMSYGAYLDLDTLLSAQRPVSEPEHHDELLFIIQHQTTELWLKLVLHELAARVRPAPRRRPAPALKRVARVKHIQRTLTEQWSVLATLTPTEYAEFRGFLGNSSGFQSYQYRAVEFMLGNKNARMLRVFETDPAAHALLARAAGGAEPVRRVPAPTCPRRVMPSRRRAGPGRHRGPRVQPGPGAGVHGRLRERRDALGGYEACEELVDLEDNFQLWRFRHLKTVERTIGMKRGTGGSSGVAFLAGRWSSPSSRSCTRCAPRSARPDRSNKAVSNKAWEGAAGGGRSFHRRQRFGGRH